MSYASKKLLPGDVVTLKEMVDLERVASFCFYDKTHPYGGMFGGKIRSASGDTFIVVGCAYYMPVEMIETVNGKRATFIGGINYVQNELS